MKSIPATVYKAMNQWLDRPKTLGQTYYYHSTKWTILKWSLVTCCCAHRSVYLPTLTREASCSRCQLPQWLTTDQCTERKRLQHAFLQIGGLYQTPPLITQGSLWKRGYKDYKSQRWGMNKGNSAFWVQQGSCKYELTTTMQHAEDMCKFKSDKVPAHAGSWTWNPPHWGIIGIWWLLVQSQFSFVVWHPVYEHMSGWIPRVPGQYKLDLI